MGFNMSWIFVEGIAPDQLYDRFDLAPTGEPAAWHDFGTSDVPLAGAFTKSGWCAVFTKYAFVMDLSTGTQPPRLRRLPSKSRAITCVVLEHAMISYASCWHDGRPAWQILHDSRQGREHLEAQGDLPAEFEEFREAALKIQRATETPQKPGDVWGSVDYVFDVPLDTAATITGYRHTRPVANDLFGNVQMLVPTNGNVLNKLCEPPTWWQTARSTKYE